MPVAVSVETLAKIVFLSSSNWLCFYRILASSGLIEYLCGHQRSDELSLVHYGFRCVSYTIVLDTSNVDSAIFRISVFTMDACLR